MQGMGIIMSMDSQPAVPSKIHQHHLELSDDAIHCSVRISESKHVVIQPKRSQTNLAGKMNN